MAWISELHPVMLGVLQLAAVGVPACVCAFLMRRASIAGGAPAAAIVGGIVAGLIFGVTVGGRVMPEVHDRVFLGGVGETIALAELSTRHLQERMALQMTGVSAEAGPGLLMNQELELKEAEALIDAAQERHAAQLKNAGLLPIVMIGASGLLGCALRRRRVFRAVGPAAIGFALAGVAAALVGRVLGLAWDVAIPFGVMMAAPGLSRRIVKLRHRRVLTLVWSLWLPTSVALLASVIDLPELVTRGRFWWLLLVGVVASSDLRWVCYYAAIRGVSRAWWAAYPWSVASRWMRDGASIVQIVLGFLVFGLDRNLGDVIAALLAGAAVIELTRTVRSQLASHLDRDEDISLDESPGEVS